MLTCLLHEATFHRLKADFTRLADRIIPLVIADDGSLMAMGKEGHLEAPPEALIAQGPDLAYGTTDAFFSPSVGTFLDVLLNAQRLRWFQSSAAGTEHPVLQAIGAKAEQYTSCHEHAASIAEWSLWAAFDWLQDGSGRRADQAARNWSRRPSREMSGTRWLIIGFGHIGQQIARKARALGAHITGIRRSPGEAADADRILPPDQVLQALPEADIVVLCCPLTPETEGLANAEFFASMSDNALFLNVGRGGLVVEPALLTGLDRGRPAYAALDVVNTEPLPADDPIWHHPKITLTSHISALTDGAKHRIDQFFLGNLERFLEGSALEDLVDPSEFQTV